MHECLRGLRKDVHRLKQGSLHLDPTEHRWKPVDYAHEYLKIHPGLWSVQQEICQAIHEPPYKVMVPASHSVGKTYVAAVLASYWFDCFTSSSAVITTAPTARDVVDLLWREIRLLRGNAGLGGFKGPDKPLLWDGVNHYAKGYTAEKGEMFQGRHLEHMLFIFDEACLIKAPYWTTTASMFQPDGRHAWLAIGNPTDTSSQMYNECKNGGWNVINMGTLGEDDLGKRRPERDHPNITAGLEARRRGVPCDLPYPSAVTLAQFEGWLDIWADRVGEGDKTDDYLEWPPPVPCDCQSGILLPGKR